MQAVALPTLLLRGGGRAFWKQRPARAVRAELAAVLGVHPHRLRVRRSALGLHHQSARAEAHAALFGRFLGGSHWSRLQHLMSGGLLCG